MKTWTVTDDTPVDKKWWLIDAADKNVGRLSTTIATLLRGKHKPIFTPHMDTGDFVVVINAEKVKFTGNKWKTKKYYRHNNYFGLKELTAEEVLKRHPTQVLEDSVEGMLPKNKLARVLLKKLKVYAGAEHPHSAKKPTSLSL